MYKLDLEKAEPRDQIASKLWHRKKKGIPKKICFVDYAKAFDCVDHNKLWKILKKMWLPDRPTWLLRKLYAGQEPIVRTSHGTTDWFKIGKGIRQGCVLSFYLFNLYAEYIMQNARIDESQAGIKIARRNISNLSYVDDNHSNGRRWIGTKESLNEGQRGERKSWLKTQH